jgi:hypothetical protein
MTMMKKKPNFEGLITIKPFSSGLPSGVYDADPGFGFHVFNSSSRAVED